jgi:hypothetical protein
MHCFCTVLHGSTRFRTVLHGLARCLHSSAQLRMVPHGSARFRTVPHGAVSHGSARCRTVPAHSGGAMRFLGLLCHILTAQGNMCATCCRVDMNEVRCCLAGGAGGKRFKQEYRPLHGRRQLAATLLAMA